MKTYEAIIKGENIPEPGIPESFKVLLKELQSLCLDVRVLREDQSEVEIMETIDYGENDYRVEIEGEVKVVEEKSLASLGYQKQEIDDKSGEFVSAEEDLNEEFDLELEETIEVE